MDNHRTQCKGKIQLIMAIIFFSKYSVEIRTMHTTNNNREVMIGNETDDIIKDLFDSFLQRCQEDLEESMKGSEFVFDSVDLLFYKLHKIKLNRRG